MEFYTYTSESGGHTERETTDDEIMGGLIFKNLVVQLLLFYDLKHTDGGFRQY